MKIAGKLLIGFGSIVLLMILLVTISYINMMTLKKLQDDGAKRSGEAIQVVQMESAPLRAYQIVANVIINRNLDESLKEWTTEKAVILEELNKLDSFVDTDKEKAWMAESDQAFADFIADFEGKLWPALQGSTEMTKKITDIDASFDLIVVRFEKPIGEIAQSLMSENTASDVVFDQVSQQSVITSIILALIALIASGIIGVVISGSITKPLGVAVSLSLSIAEGDLTRTVPEAYLLRKDEIGDLAVSLKDMLIKLVQIIGDVNSSSSQVSSGSQQLSSTSQQMAQGASEQASSVEEISASMEEMTSNIKQNADNAMQTEKIAQKSTLSAEEGGRAVSATVNAMKDIASKIGIIEEIARSTNMLALNASIEAARAGEFGKGFAVVASEVGKLAERSQKEAGEISKLSKESVSIAEQAGSTISAMLPDIKRTAELVQEISAASNEQNIGAEQINSAIMQLDKVVQQNASASEESASMSEELASQAEQMQATIAYFTITQTKKSAQEKTVSLSTDSARTHASRTGKAASKNPARTSSRGINLVLDDDTKTSGRDSLDNDFKEM